MQHKNEENLQFSKIFGNYVRELRETRTNFSCSMFDAAYELGGNLNRIENGKISPSINLVYKIVEVLDMTFNEFAKGLEEKVKQELGKDFTLIDR